MIEDGMPAGEPPLDSNVQIVLSSPDVTPEINGKAGHNDSITKTEHNQVSNSTVSQRRSWSCRDESSCCGSRSTRERSGTQTTQIKDHFHGRNVLAFGGRLVCGPPEE